MVTIFIGPNLLAKTRAEISANTTIPLEHNSRIRFVLCESDVYDFILTLCSTPRILTTIDSTEQDVFKLLGPLVGSYPEAYKTLHEAKAITCATTGVTYSAVKAPVAVLLDVCFFLSGYTYHLTFRLKVLPGTDGICNTGDGRAVRPDLHLGDGRSRCINSFMGSRTSGRIR